MLFVSKMLVVMKKGINHDQRKNVELRVAIHRAQFEMQLTMPRI